MGLAGKKRTVPRQLMLNSHMSTVLIAACIEGKMTGGPRGPEVAHRTLFRLIQAYLQTSMQNRLDTI